MNTVHLVIDDKPIIVPEGTNIFQAALDNGIYVPGLCYHPKLSQFGGCRLCMVDMARFFMNFCANESCGKCPPCRIGTTLMLDILTRITQGQGEEKDLEVLEQMAD